MSFVPYICMQTNSKCYKNTSQMTVKGIMWHSTGADNPYLWRYVQPTDGSPNYDADIKKLGKNTNGNDWNHQQVDAGLNAWIGKFDDGTVGTVQSMPWDFRPWGCGDEDLPITCNSGWIQFEICEDSLNDRNYAERVFEEACQLTAYLCRLFRLNVDGYADCGGVSVPVITCHNDAAKLNRASDHADINHWFPKILGKNMVDARKRVKEILEGLPAMESFSEYITKLPSRGYFLVGDGYKVELDFKPQIRQIQGFLNWAIGTKLSISGKYGQNTEKAVMKFQKAVGITVDGSWGRNTLEKAKTYKK